MMASEFFLDARVMRLRRLRQRIRSFVDLAGDKGQTGFVKGRWLMATLTYAGVDDWRPDHISEFIHRADSWARRRGFKLVYCWVAELQQRGAVHYHVLIKLPKGFTFPKPDKQGWWPHGLTERDWVRKSGRGYMAKYASKDAQRMGLFHKGLRLCGCGGLPEDARAWFRWLLCPTYARHEFEPKDFPRRVRGGVQAADGRFVPSPFSCTPVPEFGGIIIHCHGPDWWRKRAKNPFPVEQYLLRSDAEKRAEVVGDIVWKCYGRSLSNPWKGASVFEN